MNRFTGINHLAMVTSDMDKTVRYWRDLLGMRLVAGLGAPGYRHYFFEISESDMIAFFEWSGAENIPEKDHGAPVKGPIAFDHVSIGLKTFQDLWQLKEELEAAGFWVSEAVDHGFVVSIYSFDPNNIPVEFSVDTRGADIRRNPKMTDSKPSMITKEGPEPQKGKWPDSMEDTSEEHKIYPAAGSELFNKD